MKQKRRWLRRTMKASLFISSLSTISAHGEVNPMAQAATLMATTAGVIAAVDSGISLANCFTPGGGTGHVACALLGVNIAATAAGFMAAGKNSESAAETDPGIGDSLAGLGAPSGANASSSGYSGASPGFSLSSIGYNPADLNDQCRRAPSICSLNCNGDTCTPEFASPYEKSDVLEKIDEQISLGNVDLEGLSPEEYKSQLGNNLDQFENALAELTNLGQGGTYGGSVNNSGSSIGGPRALASQGSLEGTPLDPTAHLSEKEKANRQKVKDLVNNLGLDLNLSEALRKRARRKKRNKKNFAILGGELIDQSGRKLNLFERASKAIRGQHDRDLVMGHYENIRKRRLQLATKKAQKKKLSQNTVSGEENNPTPLNTGLN